MLKKVVKPCFLMRWVEDLCFSHHRFGLSIVHHPFLICRMAQTSMETMIFGNVLVWKWTHAKGMDFYFIHCSQMVQLIWLVASQYHSYYNHFKKYWWERKNVFRSISREIYPVWGISFLVKRSCLFILFHSNLIIGWMRLCSYQYMGAVL